MHKWFPAVLTFALVASVAAAEEECRLQLAAALPITLNGYGLPMVPAAVGDKPLQLMADTGAPISALTGEAVERLGLEPELIGGGKFQFYGGAVMDHFVPVKNFRLGKMNAPSASFPIMPQMAGVDGLLGYDFLKQFDVDFDFANGKLNLFVPHRCPGRVVYWTADEPMVAIIPFTINKDDGHILVHVTLDGRDMQAILDTGASGTVMNLDSATDWFDLTADSPGVEKLPDNFYRYRFKTMTIGSVTVNNPQIVMQPRSVSHFDNYRMILGENVLHQLHVFIAYKERKLYITAASQK